MTNERTPIRTLARGDLAPTDRAPAVLGPRITLPLRAAPACLSESIAVTLRAHGLSLSAEILRELGNNLAQALVSLDENPDNQ